MGINDKEIALEVSKGLPHFARGDLEPLRLSHTVAV